MARLESFVSDAEIEALYRPTAEARGLPARAYVDEEFWHLEREKLFPRTWMACAYESDVPEPGDVCPLSIAGWELILTRNREGVVNVFHNVCAHRAMRVVNEPCRGATSLRCPWHSWIYDLEGQLVRTPGLGGVNVHEAEGFNTGELGLKRVRAGTWLGYVFINLDGKAPPLAEHLASLEARLVDYDLSQLRFSGLTTGTEFEGNWKLVYEGGVEDYHLPWIHPELGPHAGTFEIDFDDGGTFVGASSRQPVGQDTEPGRLPLFPHLENGGESPDGLGPVSSILYIPPTAVLAVNPNHVSTTIIVPRAHNHTHHRRAFHFIGDESLDDSLMSAREQVREGWIKVGDQDRPLVAQVQKQQALRADIDMETRFSPYWESGVQRFQQMVVERLRDDVMD